MKQKLRQGSKFSTKSIPMEILIIKFVFLERKECRLFFFNFDVKLSSIETTLI